MRRTVIVSVLAALWVLALVPAIAPTGDAQAATLTRSLRDLGFSAGLRLRRDDSASVFLRIPRGAVLKGVTLETFGSGTAAGLTAATVHWFVNDVPVDALTVRPGIGRWTIGRLARIRASGPDGTSALTADARNVDVRYAVDLREEARQCQRDDEANALAIAPASRIRLELDVSGVDTLAGALEMLPSETPIVLPLGEQVSERAFAAALRLSLAITNSGRRPRFVARRPDDALVALQITSNETPSDDSGRPRLIRPSEEHFDVLVDETDDLGALLRLWNREPGLLSDDVAPSLIARAPGAEIAQTRRFARLPAASVIGRRGEWVLPFELTDPDGRIPDGVDLALRVAPDWSEEQPILTVFLNDQIIDAKRLRTDRANAASISLPPALLQQDNALRLVVDRAPQPGPCLYPGEGLYGQLLMGTHLRLGGQAASGFGAVARNLDDGDGFRIRLPEEALARPLAAGYLAFLSDVLVGLNADGTEPLVVVAGPPTSASAPLDDLALEAADPEGLTVELSRDAALAGTLAFDAGTPFAAATIEGNRLRLTVPEALESYRATQFDFRSGDRALLGTEGVVWQNGAEYDNVALQRSAWDLIDRMRDIAGRFGIVFLVGVVGVILAVLGARKAIVRRAARKRTAQASA